MRLSIKKWTEEKMKDMDLTGRTLVIVKTTDDPASDVYMKKKASLVQTLGGSAIILDLSDKAPELQPGICDQKHSDWLKDGRTAVIVQYPTNKHMEKWVEQKMSPSLDIDGLTDGSVARLVRAKRPEDLKGVFVPNTALGIMDFLLENVSEEDKDDARLFIAGRSMLVGKPLSHLASVHGLYSFVAHSETPSWVYWDEFADSTHSIWARGLQWTPEEVAAIRSSKDFGASKNFKHTFFDVSILRDENGIKGEIPKEMYEEEFMKTNDYSSVPGGCGLLTVYALVKQLSQL